MFTLAAIDIDALIPLIVGVFWVVAQIAGAAAKKKGRPPRPAPEGTKPQSDDPFAELMRKLGGVQEFKIPQPPEPKKTQEKTARSERLAPPTDSEPRGRTTPPAEPILPESTPEIPEIDIRPTMSSLKTAMPPMMLPAMNLSFRTSEKSSGGFPKVGKIIDPSDQQTLRRAILGQIILGKPRAMEDWNTGRVE